MPSFSVFEPKPGYYYVATYENRKRVLLSDDPASEKPTRFATRAAAERFAARMKKKANAADFRQLSPFQRREYWELAALVASHDLTLREAVEKGLGRSNSWPERIHDHTQRFLEFCARKRQLDPSSVDFYRHKLAVLFREFPHATFGDFPAHRIKSAIQSHANSPSWETGALRAISAFFNWGARQHPPLCPYGLTRGVSLDHPVKPRAIDFLTVEEAARFLHAASQRWSRPALALMAFAGIRKKTTEKMRWDWIDFERKTIHIPAHVSKVRAQLIETAPPVLWEWIRPDDAAAALQRHRRREGDPTLASAPICHAQLRDQVTACAAASGVPSWPHSALRHTFITYHYAAFKDAEATRAISGHDEDARTLEERYRGIDTRRSSHTYLATAHRAATYLSLTPQLCEAIATGSATLLDR